MPYRVLGATRREFLCRRNRFGSRRFRGRPVSSGLRASNGALTVHSHSVSAGRECHVSSVRQRRPRSGYDGFRIPNIQDLRAAQGARALRPQVRQLIGRSSKCYTGAFACHLSTACMQGQPRCCARSSRAQGGKAGCQGRQEAHRRQTCNPTCS